MISKALVVGAYHKKNSELANFGIDLHLIVPRTWGRQKPEVIEASNYTIHLLPIFFSGKNHFHFYQGLKSLVDSINPDIIHIDEEPYSLVTYQASRIAKEKNIPTLFFTWQNIKKKYPFPFSALERYAFDNAHAAIAGNLEASDVMREKGFSKKIFIVPQFGVDPQIYSKRDAGSLKVQLFGASNVQVIGYVGRFVEEKGIQTLLQAFSKLDRTARLFLIGSGPYKKKILETSGILDINDRLQMPGDVPSDKIPLYLNCLDCFVLPSLTRPNWKEQFGRVLIEAMSCGVPVIGSDSGEIPNVIGDAGLIFNEGDADDLLRKMEIILNDQILKEQYRRRGRSRVIEHFTQKHIAEQTLKVYEFILQRRNV